MRLRRSYLSLARQAVNIDTGSAQSSTSTIVLFVARLLCHVEQYVSLLLRKRPNRLATLGGLLPRLPEPQDSSHMHKRTTEAPATLRLGVVAVAQSRPSRSHASIKLT